MASATTSRRARRSRLKGSEGEREVVQLHRAMGIDAERVPLSDAMAYQENGEDGDVHVQGRGEAPLACQVKRQATDAGWKTLLGQLGDASMLFFRQDRGGWFVLMPLDTYKRLLGRAGRRSFSPSSACRWRGSAASAPQTSSWRNSSRSAPAPT